MVQVRVNGLSRDEIQNWGVKAASRFYTPIPGTLLQTFEPSNLLSFSAVSKLVLQT